MLTQHSISKVSLAVDYDFEAEKRPSAARADLPQIDHGAIEEGAARHGPAQLGTARRSSARPGRARRLSAVAYFKLLLFQRLYSLRAPERIRKLASLKTKSDEEFSRR